MRRFAMPAFLLAGLLAMPAAPAHAGDEVCVGLTVAVLGITLVDSPARCAEEPLIPLFCSTETLDLSPVAVIGLVICTPGP